MYFENQDFKIAKIFSCSFITKWLQFRNLVKKYNCDLCFTPMILADSFCKSGKARNNEFSTNLDDTPTVIQFAANTVDDFVGAAVLASPFCSGVDLNCGCPQRWARQQGLGCILLESPEKIFDLTRECRNRIKTPFTVSVKTRIFKDLRKTVEICRQIEKAGASFLTIHARTAENSSGEINNEALRMIKQNINIPLIANGGLRSLEECYELQRLVGCDGVMVANAILQNPTLFSGQTETSLDCIQNWVNICYNSTISQERYNSFLQTDESPSIPERPPNLTFQCFHHHLVFMLEKILPKKKRRIFNNFKKFNEVLEFLREEFDIEPNLFNSEDFRRVQPIQIIYYDNNLVSSIKDESEDDSFTYFGSNGNGKYFTSKLEEEIDEDCDWSDMFLENG